MAQEDDLFKDDSTKAESSWMKWEKVGDTLQGVLVMEPYDKDGDLGKQRVYVLQKANGDEVNVGFNIEKKAFIIRQLNKARVGDIVALRYTGNVEVPGKPQPAKNIEVRIRSMGGLSESDVREAGL